MKKLKIVLIGPRQTKICYLSKSQDLDTFVCTEQWNQLNQWPDVIRITVMRTNSAMWTGHGFSLKVIYSTYEIYSFHVIFTDDNNHNARILSSLVIETRSNGPDPNPSDNHLNVASRFLCSSDQSDQMIKWSKWLIEKLNCYCITLTIQQIGQYHHHQIDMLSKWRRNK